MTSRWFIFLFLLIGAIYFYSTRLNQKAVKTGQFGLEKLEEKLKPSNYWEDRWSYPSTESQADNYKLAVAIAEKEIVHQPNAKSGLTSNWRMEGPTNIGGRANCLMVDSRDTNTIYAGMAAGGIFKTINGGGTWLPIADDFAFLSISWMVQDPLYPDTIYAATGDRNFGSWGRIGDGVKVSYDAGLTWQSSGLENEGIVSKLVIDSTNRILWASVLGNPRVSNLNRGVYRSTDMGKTWQNVHFVNDRSGAIDMVIDPFDPQTLYVSYFNRSRTSTQSSAAGNDGRVWQTTDGGNTWSMLTNGLPNYPVSRIGLAISTQTPGKLYATVVSDFFLHEGLYKSLDTGKTWTREAALGLPTDYTGGFGWYFGQVRVNPFNDDEVWLLGVDMFTSSDGGNSFIQSVPDWRTNQVHADKHDLHFTSSNGVLLATDGGLYRGSGIINDPDNWVDIDLIPNNQFYRVAVNPHKNQVYAGGVQDNGTVEGINSQVDNWTRLFGGDGFQMIYDPIDSNIFYFETQNGNLYAFDNGTLFANFDFDFGVSPARNWDMPFIMSRFNRNKLYCLSDMIHRTENGPYGSFTPVNFSILHKGISLLTNNYGSALCESKLDSNLLYAGTGDGKVWRIDPNFGIETDISTGLPDRYVTSLTTSLLDPDLVLVTHSGYLDFETTPHIHLSTDKGSNWTPISGDLPPFAINDAEILDNTNDSVIFAASDVGVYVTFNRGINWSRVGGNMPLIPVNDITIDYSANRLIAGTFARSMQSFDLDSVISVEPLINIALGNDTSICRGDTLELGVNLSLGNYNWSTGATSPTIKVYEAGVYWLETQNNGRTFRDSITISIENLPTQLFLGNDTSICPGNTISLGSQLPDFDTYLWNTGSRSKTIVVADSGNYILQVQNKCYTITDTIRVDYFELNEAIIQSNNTNIFNNISFTNASAQVLSSSWSLDGNFVSSLDSFTYQFDTPNNYILTLASTDSNTCITNDSLLIVINPSEEYHIPNIFTPNQDGINDAFSPYGSGVVAYNTIIYNKWGAEVIELENIPWNGRDLGGKMLENGVYFFKIKLELNTGKTINESGNLFLTR